MYVIFEGVDGAGKTSLASECAAYLRAVGRPVWLANEPFVPRSMLVRLGRYSLLEQAMIFDRYRVRAYERSIAPWLLRGHSLIQVRSWLSTAVYQYYRGGYLDLLPSYIGLSLSLMPVRPLLVVLDVDYATARTRKSDLEWDATTYDDLRSGYYWVSDYLVRKTNLPVRVIRNNQSVDSVMESVMSFLESNHYG